MPRKRLDKTPLGQMLAYLFEYPNTYEDTYKNYLPARYLERMSEDDLMRLGDFIANELGRMDDLLAGVNEALSRITGRPGPFERLGVLMAPDGPRIVLAALPG